MLAHWLKPAFLAIAISVPAMADVEFRRVVATGDQIPGLTSPVASFGHWVSMNDPAQVAFQAVLTDGRHAIVRATPNADGSYDLGDSALWHVVAVESGTTRQLSDYAAINNDGQVSYRLKVTSPSFLFVIKRDSTSILTTGEPSHAISLLSPTDVTTGEDGMVSLYAVVEEGITPRHQIRKGNGVTGMMVHNTVLIAKQPDFGSFQQYTSVNELGDVAFWASHSTMGSGLFVSSGGSDPTYDIVATSPTFSAVGYRSSLNNGGHIAFYAVRAGYEGIYL